MQNLFQTIASYRLAAWQQRTLVLMAIVLLITLAACGPAADQVREEPAAGEAVEPTAEPLPTEAEAQPQPAEETQGSPAEDGYPPPAPAIPLIEESYPVETLPPPTATPIPDVYPPPTVAEVFSEPRIRLDLPVHAGDTAVTGTAPPGLALAVLDVTYNGGLLGTGKTDDDGRFNINVDGLIEGNRLGLSFGELEPGMSLADMSIKYYPHRGEGFMNLPNVGVMLDSTLIEP